MQKSLLFGALLLVTLLASISAQYAGAQDVVAESPVDQDDMDYYNAVLANLLTGKMYTSNEKRSCIRRGGPCDHRPNDCCPKSSCRCNLWGTNCRCHRLGLFQKWGKKR